MFKGRLNMQLVKWTRVSFAAMLAVFLLLLAACGGGSGSGGTSGG